MAVLAWLFGLSTALQLSALEVPQQLYYGVLLLTGFYNVLRLSSLNLRISSFLLWCFVSLLFKGDNQVFASNSRFILFVLLTLPVLGNSSLYFRAFRAYSLSWLMRFMSLLVVMSVLTKLFGMNVFDNGRADYRGFFTHSMVYGPVSGLLFTLSLVKMLGDNGRSSYLNLVLLVLFFLGISQSGSRSSLLAAILSSTYAVFLYGTRSSKIVLLMVVVFSSFLWPLMLSEAMLGKFEYASSSGKGVLVSRAELWENRLSEFVLNPFTGVGFAEVDIAHSHSYSDDGKIELGSSWLGVLSMLGGIGFVLFLSLFKTLVKVEKFSRDNPLIVFFVVHMLFEGYVVSVGNGLSVVFWLLIINSFSNESSFLASSALQRSVSCRRGIR